MGLIIELEVTVNGLPAPSALEAAMSFSVYISVQEVKEAVRLSLHSELNIGFECSLGG